MNKYFIIAIALVSALIAAFLYHEYEKPKLELAKEQAAQAKAVALSTQKARVAEQKVSANDNAASTEYQKGLEDGKNQLQAANDDLRAKLNRLRKQLATSNSMPNVSSTVSGRNAPDNSALPQGYGDKLVEAIGIFGEQQQRLASEADDQSKQLSACQKELLARSQPMQ